MTTVEHADKYRAAYSSLIPSGQRVAMHIAMGRSNKEISSEERLSPSTIKNKLPDIFRSFEVADRYSLAARFVQANLLDPKQYMRERGISEVALGVLSDQERVYMRTLAGLEEQDGLPIPNSIVAQRTGRKLQSVKNALVIIGGKLSLPDTSRTTLIMIALAHKDEMKAA